MTDINPKQVLRAARDLADSGAYAEALEKYLWFHENALVHEPSMYGVRLSFALRYWAQLGDVYPPARSALESIRDVKAVALRDGSVDRELFQDVESINEMLGQVEQTRDLFAYIAVRNREFAQRCFRSALAALVRTGDFSLARSFISSPQGEMEHFVRQLNENLEDLPVSATASSARLHETYIGIYLEDVRQLLAVLIGVGEADEAERLHAVAVESVACSGVREDIREQLRRPSPPPVD